MDLCLVDGVPLWIGFNHQTWRHHRGRRGREDQRKRHGWPRANLLNHDVYLMIVLLIGGLVKVIRVFDDDEELAWSFSTRSSGM